MSILEARLRGFSSDSEWNFGGGRYLDSTNLSVKLPSLSRRNLSAEIASVSVTKFAHGKLSEDQGSKTGAVNSYCVANPACAAVFHWRTSSASVVRVTARFNQHQQLLLTALQWLSPDPFSPLFLLLQFSPCSRICAAGHTDGFIDV
jgi:hypothetical protein